MKDIDVIIIGGGPAGLSASLWCSELGMSSALFEKNNELGGQLIWTFNPIRNYLGAAAECGIELRDKFVSQMAQQKINVAGGRAVVSVDLTRATLMGSDGQAYTSRAMIIAAGVRRRTLDVPGESEFYGRGVLASGAGSQDEVAGKAVLIVGGGDAALENAVILSKNAEKVYVVHRRDRYTARKTFIDEARSRTNVELVPGQRLIAVDGTASLESAVIEDVQSGSRRQLDIDYLLIRIGVVPNTEMFAGQIDLDGDGYVVANSRGQTSIPNIYAAGDVTNPYSMTISNAVGAGALAARSAYSFLANQT